jgi:hypothetical protein
MRNLRQYSEVLIRKLEDKMEEVNSEQNAEKSKHPEDCAEALAVAPVALRHRKRRGSPGKLLVHQGVQ